MTNEEAIKRILDYMRYQFYTVQELIDALGISSSTYYRVLHTGRGSDATLNAIGELYLAYKSPRRGV